MLKHPQINWLADGTPENVDYSDIYYSRNSGLAESSYVFLEGNGLPDRWLSRKLFTIVELGFGTGLNFINTVRLWSHSNAINSLEHKRATEDSRLLHYIAFEKHPLAKQAIAKALASWPELSSFSNKLLDTLPEVLPGFHRIIWSEYKIFLTLIYGDANQYLPELNAKVDAWYLDGFAPAKNPELWSQLIFQQIKAKSNLGATVATFSAARVVKDGLADFTVTIKNGYGNKRDMITAKLSGEVIEDRSVKRVAIIGAGLAGALTARALKLRGIQCSVFEEMNKIATLASGAAAGVCMPYLISSHNARSEFFLNAFDFTWRQIDEHDFYSRCGVIRLLRGRTQEQAYSKFADLNLPNVFARACSANELSQMLGFEIKQLGFYFPSAGWIEPRSYATFGLTEIAVNTEISIKKIVPSNRQYVLIDSAGQQRGLFDYVVLTNAYRAKDFYPELPITTNRSQLLEVKCKPPLANLKHILCHDGYILPLGDNKLLLGGLYDHKNKHIYEDLQQTEMIIEKTRQAFNYTDDFEQCGFRAGLRTTRLGHLPLLQEIEPRIFLNITHGSRGLVTCGLSGEIIASLINEEPQPIPNAVWKLLSRF